MNSVNIYLIGFMGSGKSSSGRKIASSLRWNFADTDKVVEEKEGATVADIFAHQGEHYFRMAEREALNSVSQRSRTVVACGGGTPCSEQNLNLMKSTGVTVYLKLPADTLISRLGKSRTIRPLINDAEGTELETRVRKLLGERSEWYEQADLIIDGLNTNDEEIASLIAGLVRSRGAYL
jgi:shikimate kinase